MANKKEMNKKYFKEEGIEFIETLIKTLIRLFNSNDFPNSNYILGLGNMKVENKEECLGRIIMLSELIGFRCKVIKTNKKMEVVY